jgi:hypothetical protein
VVEKMGRTKAGASEMDEAIIVDMLSPEGIDAARLFEAIVEDKKLSLIIFLFEFGDKIE